MAIRGKRRIRINEGQYINLFCPSLLTEAKRLSDIFKIGAFSDIDEDTLMSIAGLDPTYKGGEYAGKYTLWLIDQFKKGYDIFNTEG